MTRSDLFTAIRPFAPSERLTPDMVTAIDTLADMMGLARVEDSVFEKCLNIILRHEGGYVNNPKDHGGRTNLGVTQRVWEAWIGHPVGETEMRSLTVPMVAPLYRKNYWNVCRCDDLLPGLALCVFDFAVNAGPGRAAKYLQRMADVDQDGKIGPATIAAANAVSDGVSKYSQARRDYYKSLSTFTTFGRGWLRRVDETEVAARGMK